MTLVEMLRPVAATVTANTTAVSGLHTPVDATAGNVTITLPTGVNSGVPISIEKVDATSNTVAIVGTVRGVSSTLTLIGQYESLEFRAEPGGTSWHPTANHLPKAVIDAKIASQTGAAFGIFDVEDPLYGAIPSNVSTTSGTRAQNKTAIQAAITAVQNAGSGRRVVYFRSRAYEVDAGLTISSSSVHFAGVYGGTDAGDGTSFTTLNFNFAAIGGTGTAISIGTDDGQAYDANDYSGHENIHFRQLTLKYAGGATTETALLNTPGISYGVGCYGLRDWRGGSMINDDVDFVGFERGFWGVVSDLNVWHRCAAHNCKIGYYVDARSDQNTFYDFFPYGNDTAITIDGAHQTRFYGGSFVGNGSSTTSAINLRANYSRGNFGTTFDTCWFEQLQRSSIVDSSISIGGFGTYPVTGVRIINPLFTTNGAGGGSPHINYLVTLNNCDDIVLENPTGNFGIPVNAWFHLPAGFSYAPHVTVRITQPFNAVTMFVNDGTGSPLFTEYVAGNGDHILRSANPRLRMVSEPAQPERDWFIDSPADDRWVVQQPARADGNPIIFDLRRRMIFGGAAPLSGTFQAGDLILNQSATAGSTFGWRCTTGGAPGTWETLTFATGGGASTTASGIYGDGSDGALTADGTTAVAGTTLTSFVYTATRDIYATTVTISSGATLDMAGYRLYATTSLTVQSGLIRRNGNNGSGATGGANLGSLTVGGTSNAGGAGGAGTTGTASTGATLSLGGAGGAGGAASGGGTGGGVAGVVNVISPSAGLPRALGQALVMKVTTDGSSSLYKGGQGGSGGTAATSSTGGGGGSGGGIVWIASPTITVNASGSITANGGTGGNASGSGTGAGGGGGGGGGAVVLIYHALTNSGTISAAGGTGGTAQGAGAAGAAGSAGTVFQVVN